MPARFLLALVPVLLLFILLGPAAAPSGSPGTRAHRPATVRHDIVLIVVDDESWHQMAFMPQTNALLGEAGVRFTKAFVSTPLCCPSRANILSGLYSHNHQVYNNYAPLGGATRFDDASTIATWLAPAGYRTGLFGQYLKQYYQLQPWPYVPPGWKEWHAHKYEGYYDFLLVENGATVRYGAEPADYEVDVLARKSVEFIESTPAGQPLFLYLAPYAPHSPATPAPGDSGRFADLPPYRPPSYNEADVSDKPEWVRKNPPLTWTQRNATDVFYRSQVEALQSVDRAVAEVVQALERTDRLENTAIVYTSDNGLALGAHRLLNKNCVYEDCIRVPLLIRAPGVAPRTDDHLVLNVDLAPTVAEWAGVTPATRVNGASLAGLLRDAATPWRTTAFLEVLGFSRTSTFHRANFQAVRTNRWVYAEYQSGEKELYDLVADPDELSNIAGDSSYAPKIEQLARRLEALRRE